MTDPQLILVPFSGSDEELGALDYAFGLADKHDADLPRIVVPVPELVTGLVSMR